MLRPVGALVRGQSGTRYPGTMEAKRLFFAQAGRPAPIKAQIVWKHLTFFAGDLGLVTLSTLLLGRTAAGRACSSPSPSWPPTSSIFPMRSAFTKVVTFIRCSPSSCTARPPPLRYGREGQGRCYG